jgi:hypothetical protein
VITSLWLVALVMGFDLYGFSAEKNEALSAQLEKAF